MKNRHVEVLINTGTDGPELRIRNARVEDSRRIQVLYTEIYGANYTMPTIIDKSRMKKALEGDDVFWLVGEHNNRIIGSLLYHIDESQRIAKALGAVVSKEYRKHNLANTMMNLILDKLRDEDVVDVVYATTRTTSVAPQHMAENLGFVPLGIFPNAHEVFENETHCLAAYFAPGAWKSRKTPATILPALQPFHALVKAGLAKRDIQLGSARSVKFKPVERPKQQGLIPFEIIQAPNFAMHRFRTAGNTGVFENIYVPFHEPNTVLISHDQKTEVFVHVGKDKYTMIVGGRTHEEDFALLLKSVAGALRRLDVRYIEILVDAYSPQIQGQAIEARFLPSAYFPALHKVGGKRYDYVVFSRCFEMLDFRNVSLLAHYRGFLKAYMKIWQELYVSAAFRSKTGAR